MRQFENDCCGCGLHCLGSACPNRNVLHIRCDKCGDDIADKGYVYNGNDYHGECLLEVLVADKTIEEGSI